MAGGFEGLDAGRLRSDVKAKLSAAHTAIQEQVRTVDSAVSSSIGPGQVWNGADADKFSTDWGQEKVKLNNVLTTLQSAMDEIEKAITQQETASSNSGAGFTVA